MSKTNKKILLVEDNDTLRLITKKLLRDLGYNVVEAVNGFEALTLIKMHDDIGVVLLDIMMPVMNGVDFLDHAKELKKEKGFSVCMLTALGQDTEVRKCLVKGADDFIIKPVDKEILEFKVSTLLDTEPTKTFTSIDTSISGEILRLNSNHSIQISELSESEMSFFSNLELPVGAKIQVESPVLRLILKSDTRLILRVFSSRKVGEQYLCSAAFIGLQNLDSQNLRAVTTRGEGIYE